MFTPMLEMPQQDSPTLPLSIVTAADMTALEPSWPRITVVTPSYNQGQYIEETLMSVLTQGYPNLEYIVIDGGSTDETPSILRLYSEQLTYWVSEKDAGQSDAINKGFARSTGDIVGWLNSDDKLAPGSLFALAEAFRVSKADIVAGVVEIARDGEIIYRHRTGLTAGPLPLDKLLDLPDEWLAGRFFFQPEVYMSRRALDTIGGRVDQSLYYSMDYDLWVRLAAAGATIAPIDATIAEFRVHAEQKTSSAETYIPELSRHNAALRHEYGFADASEAEARPHRRALRVGMVNDMGFLYGAGRAHRRIAAVLASAGMQVAPFALRADLNSGPSTLEDAVGAMAAFQPDVIIVGNLHGVLPEGADLLQLAEIAPLLVITHDFFWFTGRCPYTGDCRQYLDLCSSECPTRDEYPVIPYHVIPKAHVRKMELWRSPKIYFAANSQYVYDWAFKFLSQQGSGAERRLQHIHLGVPEREYRPQDRHAARQRYGLADDAFVVLVSSTSVGDPRKRVEHVLAACAQSGVEELHILAMGHVHDDERLPGVSYTGYLESDEDIAACFNAADVFVGASSDETYGQTFVEAAKCGCPSIAYDVGALRETIIDGVTGWLVTDGDTLDMAARLAALASDPHRRDAIRARVFVNAEARFGAPTMLQSLQDTLREIVDNPDVRIPAGAQFSGAIAQPITWLETQSWRTSTGFSDLEGPFTDLGIGRKLAWQILPDAFLEARVAADGWYEITIECETLASDQVINIEAGGYRFNGAEIQPSYWRLLKVICLTAPLHAGWNRLAIHAATSFMTGGRSLRLAVFNVSCSPAKTIEPSGELSRRLGLEGSGMVLDREVLPPLITSANAEFVAAQDTA